MPDQANKAACDGLAAICWMQAARAAGSVELASGEYLAEVRKSGRSRAQRGRRSSDELLIVQRRCSRGT